MYIAQSNVIYCILCLCIIVTVVLLLYLAIWVTISLNTLLFTSLPVRDGGLGIRSVSSLALPAFVASAASTLSLQSDILADRAFSNNDFLQT